MKPLFVIYKIKNGYLVFKDDEEVPEWFALLSDVCLRIQGRQLVYEVNAVEMSDE